MQELISYIQIAVAVLLIVLILFQQRGTALGSAFGGGGGGGGEGGGFYATRRGIQQKIFWATIILGIVFIGLSLLTLGLQ
ncbi:preprotein translocase subunit SecG [Candidatus Parcubacteria bacterium]|nr:preprotein translocase subunit SecG [Candidatus Parcubacteria bacterium]